MCGKMETVELLLDKGVNFDLRDNEGRTVFEVLDQFKANKASEIKRKIQCKVKRSHMSALDSVPLSPSSHSSHGPLQA